MPTINGISVTNEWALNIKRLVLEIMGEDETFHAAELLAHIKGAASPGAAELRDALLSRFGPLAISEQTRLGRIVAGCRKVGGDLVRIRRMQHPHGYVFTAYSVKD